MNLSAAPALNNTSFEYNSSPEKVNLLTSYEIRKLASIIAAIRGGKFKSAIYGIAIEFFETVGSKVKNIIKRVVERAHCARSTCYSLIDFIRKRLPEKYKNLLTKTQPGMYEICAATAREMITDFDENNPDLMSVPRTKSVRPTDKQKSRQKPANVRPTDKKCPPHGHQMSAPRTPYKEQPLQPSTTKKDNLNLNYNFGENQKTNKPHQPNMLSAPENSAAEGGKGSECNNTAEKSQARPEPKYSAGYVSEQQNVFLPTYQPSNWLIGKVKELIKTKDEQYAIFYIKRWASFTKNNPMADDGEALTRISKIKSEYRIKAYQEYQKLKAQGPRKDEYDMAKAKLEIQWIKEGKGKMGRIPISMEQYFKPFYEHEEEWDVTIKQLKDEYGIPQYVIVQ